VYVPPNLQLMTEEEKKDFNQFKIRVKSELLEQPLKNNYFFGNRLNNQRIGKLFDENKKKKKELIEKLILPKLDDHIWLRAYAVEENYSIDFQEIFDMAFIKAKSPGEFSVDDYELVCPEKVVE
jgi:hypothetical protein